VNPRTRVNWLLFQLGAVAAGIWGGIRLFEAVTR
jgi:hypothetical protein